MWVEISDLTFQLTDILSLPWRGVWVEIVFVVKKLIQFGSHSLGGECGLKSILFIYIYTFLKSLPWRGVWVEISYVV